jgi:hypothetical protein
VVLFVGDRYYVEGELNTAETLRRGMLNKIPDPIRPQSAALFLFVWLVADGWCWFVPREKYCWLVVGGWFVLREKHCRLMADKPSEQAARPLRFLYSSDSSSHSLSPFPKRNMAKGSLESNVIVLEPRRGLPT